MSSGRSALMRKCPPSVRSYDSPRVTRTLPSPCALISAPSFSPTPLLSAKMSQLPGLAGADGCGAGCSLERSLGCHWNSYSQSSIFSSAARFVSRSMRSIGDFHFTQHFAVALPQLSDALERGAIGDTTFAKLQIVVMSGDLR